MKLKHITFTGVDGKTDLERLWELQQQYPIAEFGVLVAKNWRENGNRYFNPTYLESLHGKSNSTNLCAHLCGSVARAAVNGNWEPFREWGGCNYPFFFKRCQINISTSAENPESFLYEGDAKHFDEVILQQKSADNCPLFMNSKDAHVSVLLDASGGEGINTPLVPLNVPRKVGYAGGLNADNVAEKLSFLLESDQVGDFWIDMESGVRTDDWFDLDKVTKVLEICDDVIKEHEK